MRSRTRWAVAGLLALAAGFVSAGCGTSGSGSDGTGTGELAVSVTDAPGDFVKYEVRVVSVSLRKANGAEVETVPVGNPIDFAQLTDLTEFVRTATVPNGRYVAATLHLDYTGADIRVDDGATAGGVPVGSIVGTDGTPVTTLSVSVNLDGSHPLVVAPGVTRHLTLDFDLAAGNQVDWSAGSPVLTVQPTLAADLAYRVPKPHRVRGALQSTDPAARSFVLELRPFDAARDFGAFTVTTDDNTVFKVDAGAPTKGTPGFGLLRAKSPMTSVIAVGDFTGPDGAFLAWRVLAGTAVAGGTLDLARGVVVKREGNTLWIRGAGLDRDEGTATFAAEYEVTVGEQTKVTRQLAGTSPALPLSDISVGQRVLVAGSISDEDIDATQGQVRLLLTPVSGILTGKPEGGGVVLDLRHIAGRRVGAFDFTGTSADPSAYAVDTGPLNLASFGVGAPVRALGFVRPFGSATPDFTAQTLVNLEGVPALLRVNWEGSVGTAFSSVSATAAVLSLADAGELRHVFRAGVGNELLDSPAPRLVPGSAGLGLFALRLKKGPGQAPVTVYVTFAAFAQALDDALAEGATVSSLSAAGQFDDETQTLTTNAAFVQLRAAPR